MVRARYPASSVRRRLLTMYAGIAPPANAPARSAIPPAPGLRTAPDTTTGRWARPDAAPMVITEITDVTTGHFIRPDGGPVGPDDD